MRTFVLLSATGCLGLAAAVSLPRADSGKGGKPGPVAALVRQLGDDTFARREEAGKKLEALGEKALPELVDAAADSPDLETRRRARRLVRRMMPESRTSKALGLKLVRVESGAYQRGSPPAEKGRRGDEPQHRVWVSRPFFLGAHEVTQNEYQKVMKATPSWFSKAGDGSGKVQGLDTGAFPVEQVTWYDAVEFCNGLSRLDGLAPYYKVGNVRRDGGAITAATVTVAGGSGYRLPTEAEWEHACRAGTTTPFHYGVETPANHANLKPVMVSGGYGGYLKWPDLGRTAKVGSYKPNAWGLYDMHGNVAEWCEDWYGKDHYTAARAVDPKGPAKGTHRVLRGGSWLVTEASARSASRLFLAPEDRKYFAGFRVARSP